MKVRLCELQGCIIKGFIFLLVFLGKFSMGLSLPCKIFDLTTLRPPEREREMEGEGRREKWGDTWEASALLTPSC